MNRRPIVPLGRLAGFTLLEAVMAITITAVLAGIVAVFIKTPVEGYFDAVRRADLTDAADTALRRIARDVRTALPNSLRAAADGSDQCFEFLPVAGGGRYRAAPDNTGAGNVFDFTSTGTFSFDVLADNGLGSLPAGTHHAVVYNLGISGADAYGASNRRPISSVTGTAPAMTVALPAGVKFPFESPGKRFHAVPDYAIVYSCAGGNLYRSTRAISSTPMASCPSAGTVLTANVSTCSFGYTPAVSQRNGLLTLTLALTQAGESVQLHHEVHVDNAP